jgi:hypothetical protein
MVFRESQISAIAGPQYADHKVKGRLMTDSI